MNEILTTVWTAFSQWTSHTGPSALIGVIIIAALLLMVQAYRYRAREQQLEQQQIQHQQELDALNSRLDALLGQQQSASLTLHSRELELTRLEEKLRSESARLQDRQKQHDQLQQRFERLQQDHLTLEKDHARLTTSLQEKQQHFDDQLRLLNDAREQLKKDFELLANDILENKGKAFRDINQQSIQQLLNPVQAEMKNFREKVESIHSEDLRQRSELKTELLNLQRLNQEITDKAEGLTNALQGQKKVQGNWGELILEKVLDSSGLRAGTDYQREVSLKNEDGQQQRPDAIIYLPQEKHLVIDAKTSLVSYTRYVNAENELERATALAEHTRAVSDRIDELAKRDYYKLPGLNSPEVVILFIPIESAYVEALRHDETLYQKAIEKNVLVATPTTLLTSLNIVRQLWQFEDRNKHTEELAKRASRFHQKLNTFLGSLLRIGSQLDSARDSYDQALKQFYSGKGNLIKQAAEFRDLGVSIQRELPAELVDMANLELDQLKASLPAAEADTTAQSEN